MKIAIIEPRATYHVAGSEKVSFKHAEHLSCLGHEIDFYTSLTVSPIEESFLFKEFVKKELPKVNILRFNITNSLPQIYNQEPDTDHIRWVTESMAFNEMIHDDLKQRAPNIILSYYLPDNLFKPSNIPNVLYLSGYPSKPVPWYKSFIKFCDATIAISNVVSQKWSEYLQEMPLQYSLGTGVDYPLRLEKTIMPRAKYNLVYAGRLIERKGVMTLIEAFNLILKEEQDVHLWILGDGEMKGKIESTIHNYGIDNSVSVMGLVQNPYDYFNMSDVCVFPSYQGDGLMGTVLEAMASGKAVVATTNNGNEDVITNGINGILVSPQDPDAVRSAVIDLLRNNEKRMSIGSKAQEFIANNVAWEKNVKKLDAILQEIVSKA